MSGWIKVEKGLTETIRFRRVVRKLRDSNALRGVTENSEAFAVTVVLGALVRFWVYADSHIRDDDTLDITLDEINEIVGVEGFAQALPAEWLQVIDAERVQLPNFLDHNGSSEKQRRDNARRQAEYRHRHHSRNVTRDVTPSNTRNDARPDQTRPDKTRPEESKKRASHEFDDSYATIEAIKLEYPKGTYKAATWQLAQRQVWDRLGEGALPDELILAAKLYREQMRATKSEGTQFVKAPQNFYDGAGYWRGPFNIPPTKAEAAQDANVTVSREWLQKSNAPN